VSLCYDSKFYFAYAFVLNSVSIDADVVKLMLAHICPELVRGLDLGLAMYSLVNTIGWTS